jgi:ribose/xylose/arabinose/galactoside ABC-type transport system permease subunit
VVVAVGLTFVEPLANLDLNVPGVMAILAAPVVAQLSLLLEPETILVGLAVNDPIVGLCTGFTVTVRADVDEPAAFLAVNVYVVVSFGLTFVEPLADLDLNVPGVMAILAAPVVAQLSLLLEPETIVVGLAVKDPIVGLCTGVTETVRAEMGKPAALRAVNA